MKRLFVVAVAISAANAYADNVVGNASLLVSPDQGPGFSQFEVNDEGGELVAVSGAQVNLQKQSGGYKGFAFGRPFNMSCSATQCTDSGSTQLNLTVTPIDTGYKLSGTLNFVSVDASVTDSKISMSVMGFNSNTSFELDRRSNGGYSGDGNSDALRTFSATLSTSGTLSGLKDPASFIVLVVSPFVRR